jgi:hypothetical protein
LTGGTAWRSKATGEPVAQVVEHETFNLGAVGSSPTGLTNAADAFQPSETELPWRVPRPFPYRRVALGLLHPE